MFWKTAPYCQWLSTVEKLWASQKYAQAQRMIVRRTLSDYEKVHLFYLAVVFSCSNAPGKYPILRPVLPEVVVEQLYAEFGSVLDPNTQVPFVPQRRMHTTDTPMVSLLNGILLFAPSAMIAEFLKMSTSETLMGCNVLMHMPADKMTVELLDGFEQAGLDLDVFMLQFHPVVRGCSPFQNTHGNLRERQVAQEQRARLLDELDCSEGLERKRVI